MILDWNDKSISYEPDGERLKRCNTAASEPVHGYGALINDDMYILYADSGTLYLYINGVSYDVKSFVGCRYIKIFTYEFFSITGKVGPIIKRAYHSMSMKSYIDSAPLDLIDEDELFFLHWLSSILKSRHRILQCLQQWK